MEADSKISLNFAKIPRTLKPNGSVEVVKGLYDEWAETFDKDNENSGYAGGRLAADRLHEILQEKNYKDDIRILDVGAGTGLISEVLKAHGYCNIDALDVSQEMLKRAEKKNLYQKYICASVGEEQLPIKDSEYDAVIAIGCFSCGHIKSDGFDEVLRVLKPGGIFMFTVRVDQFEDEKLGFAAKIEELEKSKIWTISEKEKTDFHLIFDECSGYRYFYRFVCYKF